MREGDPACPLRGAERTASLAHVLFAGWARGGPAPTMEGSQGRICARCSSGSTSFAHGRQATLPKYDCLGLILSWGRLSI